MTTQYSIAKARDRLPSLVHQVEQGPAVELTRRGRPVAVLLSIAEYRSLRHDRPDFLEAVQQFRGESDLEGLRADETWEDVRDRAPGREPSL